MGELSLHLKYRPKRFKEFYGNLDVLQKLISHLMKPNRSHFFLVSGPYGCGKTTLARLIAMSVNCDMFLKERDVGRCLRVVWIFLRLMVQLIGE
jgi:DNA polymerase-3 subunit gamma/tau